MNADNKILFAGPVGAGKTSAIQAISDFPPVSTDVHASEDERTHEGKTTTTVSMDYGHIELDDGIGVHLYGTPGQRRFSHMWDILTQGGLGLVLLVDNSREDPLADLTFYLEAFADFVARTAVVIGVTHTDTARQPKMDDYLEHLASHHLSHPVFEVNATHRNDIVLLVQTLLACLQTRPRP